MVNYTHMYKGHAIHTYIKGSESFCCVRVRVRVRLCVFKASA